MVKEPSMLGAVENENSLDESMFINVLNEENNENEFPNCFQFY